MALPRIEPYRPPTAAELPTPRVDWFPDPRRAVLLVHDVQLYFLRPFADAGPLLDAVGALRERCRAAGVPVVYTAQPPRTTLAERGLQQDFWGDGLRAVDPALAGHPAELAPAAGEPVLPKWRYSAFARSGLAELMADWGRDQLLVTGVYAHIGCLATALDAFMRDVQPFLVADALGDFSRRHHDEALAHGARHCAVAVTAGAVTTALQEPAA